MEKNGNIFNIKILPKGMRDELFCGGNGEKLILFRKK